MLADVHGGHRWIYVATALLGLASLSACSRTSSDDPKKPSAGSPSDAPPEPLALGPEAKNVLFTFKDPETGRFQTVETIDAVPEEVRAAVVVVDLSQSPKARGSGRYVHVADLRELGPDGRYPVSVASRYGFEQAQGGKVDLADSGAPSAPVVLYSASWCGVCKKARRVLSELRVPFEEKDIEASRSALEELSAKAQRAGLPLGGVPVIDVKGTLLRGLDVPRLKSVLQEKNILPG